MADTEEMAPTRATPRRSSANGSRRSAHREDDLETQVAELQADIKSITNTLGRMGQTTVNEVKSTARQRAHEIADRGQSMLDSAQGEFSSLEKQLKDTIRDKPLTAVAGAIAIGFLISVLTR
jgi:ElaB/YqjD/DUF883 family membrane-anchored ribosome-binding protein